MPPVTIYTRQFCGYSSSAKSLLKRKGVDFEEIDATFSNDMREEMRQRSGRATFPQIFVGDIHVGGSDELHALDRDGKLDVILADAA